MRRVFTLLSLASVVLASIFTFATAAQAQTYSWNSTGTDWSTASDWTPSTVPGSANIAAFNLGSYTGQPTLSAAASVGGLYDVGAGAITISGSPLTIYGTTINGNANTGIEMDSGAGALTISAPLVLQNPQTWLNNAASGVMTVSGSVNNSGNLLAVAGSGATLISGLISGGGGLTQSGGGTLIVSSSQGYGGPTTVLAGTLQLLGASQVTTTGSIGVHFVGNTTGSSSGAINGSGVVSMNNWMNLTATSFTNQALTDGSGKATTAQFSYAPPNGGGGVASNTNSSINLLNGGLNLQGDATYSLTFSGIPYTSYTLYTYVGAGPSWQQDATSTVSLGATTYYVGELDVPTGYSAVTSTNTTSGYENGDYEEFPGLTASSGTVTIFKVTSSSYGWNGFEIVGSNTTAGGSVNLLPPSTTLTVASGATFDLGGGSQQVASLSDYTPGSGGNIMNSNSAAAMLTFSPSGGASTTFSGMIQGGTNGGISLVMAGNGTQVLAGSNTYAGGTTIFSGGTLAIGGTGSLGTGGNYSGPIANSGALVVNTSSNQTFGGVISGSGTLVQSGNALTTLTNTNTFTGATSISAGTLQLGSGAPGQDGSIANTSGVSNNATLAYNLNGNQMVNYGISGPGGLTKLGGGMLTIAASQAYTGPTTVSAGTLQLQSLTQITTSIGVHFVGATTGSSSAASNGSGVVPMNNWMNLTATSFTNQALTNNSGNPTTAQFSYVPPNGGGGVAGNTNSNINLLNGGLNLQGDATYQLILSGIPYTSYTLYTYVGAGPSWQQNANSTVSLGATTYYVGELDVPTGYSAVTSTNTTSGYENGDYEEFSGLTASSGTVTIFKVSGSSYGWEGFEIVGSTTIPGAGVNVLSPATTLTVARGATLDLGGGSQQVQWLSDAGPGLGGNVINSNSAAALLTFSPSGGASTTFSGTIQGGIGLVMSGSGTQVLAGTNTYSGATQVSGGTLAAAVSGALPSTSNVSVTAGVLDVTAASQIVNALTIGAAGTLNINDLYPLTVSNTATFSGGTLNVSSIHLTPVTPDLLMTYSTSAGVGFGSVSFNGSALPGTDSLSYSGGSLEIIGPHTWNWNHSAGGSWQNNPGYWTPAGVPSNGTATFPELGATSTIQVTLDGPQTATGLVFSASEGYTLAPGSGGTLTLSNSATVAVLSGTHTISAPLQIAGGSLVVAESGNGVLNITGNISDDNGQRSLTLTGDGSGQLVLSGTNSYGGGTNVNAGTMYVTNSSALPPATNLAVGAGGTFIFDPNGPGDNVATSASHATIAVEAVPEPGTLALLIAGLAVGLGVWRRKRHIAAPTPLPDQVAPVRISEMSAPRRFE